MTYKVKVGGVEVYSTDDELAAYRYKNLCQGSVVVTKGFGSEEFWSRGGQLTKAKAPIIKGGSKYQ